MTPSVSGQPWFEAPALRRIFALLNAEGGEVRVVGGAVRNALMGHAVTEVDLATTLRPEEVVARAEAAGIKTVPTGIAHGTVTLVIDGEPFEVTTLRRDVTTDGRHAEVAFGTDWTVDAHRRDLTINALYADAQGRVIDLVGGIEDLEKQLIRFIGEASERVREDYLRVLRFFRFFAWYGRGRPDADGLRASARAKDKLSTLSAERIWSELKKLLSAEDPTRALLWMRQAGVLTAVLPESEKWGIDTIPGLVSAERASGFAPDPLLRLAAMVPPDPERLAAMAARLRLSKAEAAFFQSWAAAKPIADRMAETALDRQLYMEGATGTMARLKLAIATLLPKVEGESDGLERLGHLQRLLTRAKAWTRPRFPLSGADVVLAGVPSGPQVGVKLAMLEAHWVAGNFQEGREALLERLKASLN
ncbi:CCA tRNA nucleotidyltransferase [Rhizobium sp. CC-YZS058]|uniref:CCA tRNA nucleotidyltransferase n=1 Tax=Rhizobium sp. CC-YZS058 TaxID=3042153 RepID=UPI002B05E173|nr:CCA tRNA nucleotidyltransferase [Rhizobium sp. CC-YZS058]MEA3534176.1 CCA tRNA nucleotidyltransferase [Rhizobium sp. CC-YZS058]